jgi:hypothetical protein
MAGQVLVSLFCELNNYLCRREKVGSRQSAGCGLLKTTQQCQAVLEI